jgi:hypothetical protein
MKKKDDIFTDKEIENFAGFFNALKKVHVRLIKEGYKIKDGKIIPPDKSIK